MDSRRGPEIEKFPYPTGKDRVQAGKEFWRIVIKGHGVYNWQSVSMQYWNLVKDEPK